MVSNQHRSHRKISSLAVLAFISLSMVMSFQNCAPGGFATTSASSSTTDSVKSLLKPMQLTAVTPRLSQVGQTVKDSYLVQRATPGQSFYNYAPDVIYDNGVYHMYWCAGVGAAGDYVLHSQSTSLGGPFHASNNGAVNSYDVAINPTWNSGNFDGYETCDPSVMKFNGTFYLYYGGLATQSNNTASTKIGVAVSSDGVHFSRANGGNAIVNPAHTATTASNYGVGQPAVIYIAPYFYMSFTDTTASGADPANGAGQFVIRAQDPLFQSGLQELTGSGWVGRATGTHTGEYKFAEAFSIDLSYDRLTNTVFMANELDSTHTGIYVLDPNTFQTIASSSIAGGWHDGPSIAKNSDRTMLGRASCTSLDIAIYKGDSASPSDGVQSWNLAYSDAQYTLDQSMCIPSVNPLVFNAAWYVSHYGDLQAAFGSDLGAATTHWLNNGINEGRIGANTFASQEYMAMNRDVANAFGASNYALAIQHYINNGISEGRAGRYILRSEIFNASWYLANYADLQAAYQGDTNAATRHWLNYGANEGRQGSSTFLASEYFQMYADVANAYGSLGTWGGAQHFVLYGQGEGRIGLEVLRGEVFNAAWYLQNYPDLAAAFGSNTTAATQHWLSYGINEGRQGTPGFSSKVYLARYADIAAAYGASNYRLAIDHYIVYGLREGRSGN